MDQTIDTMHVQRFSILIISMGVVLIVMSLIGGFSTVVLLARGMAITTFIEARTDVMNFVYHFVLPFAGGILLLLSGSTLMNLNSNLLHRGYAARGRRRFAKERGKMLEVMLNSNERKVIDLIKENPDGALQSDLVIKSGFSKVKVHRILKKLENEELVRRGRFGITNKVFINDTAAS
jgi:uncharacterized membrane protein